MIGSVRKVRSASCVNNVPCIHPGVGYFFTIEAATFVAVQLRPWSMVCYGLSTPRMLAACDFLLLLVSLVLLLLLMVMATMRAACLWFY